MKKHITAIIIIILFIAFASFVKINDRYSTVIKVISPTELQINTNIKHKLNDENICIEGVEAFSLNNEDYFYKEYSKSLKISYKDLISLGYLADEYAQKLLENNRITVRYTGKNTTKCKYASVKIDGTDYSKILANSGYGIINHKIYNKNKYKNNLNNAQKLNLVILNHHSNKYHQLECPYGKIAHDMVILPYKQLPKDAKPCKFCHNIQNKIYHRTHKYSAMEITPGIISPPLEISDDGVKLYFTDYTKNLKPHNNCTTTVCKDIVNMIDNTKESIDIAIYGYDDIPEITNALIRAKDRGVQIRFVYDGTYNSNDMHYKDNNIISNIAQISKNDAEGSNNQSNFIMHNKFIIFDKQLVLTGSMNMSRSGLSDYDVNNIVVINSSDIANLYKNEFEQMLDGKFHQNKQTTGNNKYTLGNSDIEIYFSPKDNSIRRIINLINGANEYIYMPTFLITHRQIAEALVQASHRGVDVRVIMDANGANTSHSKLKMLRDNGILLKTENYAGKLHSKSIIIDNKYVITGSMNFSYSGEKKNDENILIIKNPSLTNGYKNFFLYLWTKIPNKFLKFNVNPESPQSIGSCIDGVDNNFNGKIDTEETSCKFR